MDGRKNNGGPRPGAGRPKRVFRVELTDDQAEQLAALTAQHNTAIAGSVEARDLFDAETMLSVLVSQAIYSAARLLPAE
jgi:hypothetical protein